MKRFLPILFLFPTLAFAQADASAPDAGVPGASAPSPSPSPSANEEQVVTLQGQVAALQEQTATAVTDLGILKRLKLSGYIQGRYQYAENSRQGLDARGNALVRDGFTVRRGRLKASYTGDWSQLVLQIDAVPGGVTLKDAEVHLVDPWTQKLRLVVGQTKWPFGYEVLQSSSDREFPERSRVVRAFAAGERDRGAKFVASAGALRAMAGVFDGNGTDYTAYNRVFFGRDNDKNKDVVARLGADLKWISGGVSGWYGQTFRSADAATNVVAKTFERSRIGADVQLYLDLLPIGSTAIKGEFIAGKTYFESGAERFGQPALGWYALISQPLGLSNAIAVRYDYFDGAAGRADASDSADPTRPASTNGVGTLGFALIHHWDDSLKVTAAYELPMTRTVGSAVDPKDNLFTLQLQAKF